MLPSLSVVPGRPPLAARVRSLRQLHGSAALGQAELAALAGIPVRQLRAIESLRCVPPALRIWLALAAALHCPVHELLAVPPTTACRVVVVVTRSRAAVILCAEGASVLEVRRLGRRQRRLASAMSAALSLASDYAVNRVLVNLGAHTPDDPSLAVEQVDLDDVRVRLGLPDARIATLCCYVQTRLPVLARFARYSRVTGRILPWDRAGQAVYIAAAIALAVCPDAHQPLQLSLPLSFTTL